MLPSPSILAIFLFDPVTWPERAPSSPRPTFRVCVATSTLHRRPSTPSTTTTFTSRWHSTLPWRSLHSLFAPRISGPGRQPTSPRRGAGKRTNGYRAHITSYIATGAILRSSNNATPAKPRFSRTFAPTPS
ncbi:hypothetical protein C8R46DRAFT_1116316 [Mycena filopes]|nr:hypothetical protein C8R46DRAFT_1116316 [Mycena filopes]